MATFRSSQNSMAYNNHNLRANPFRSVPSIHSDEIVWAGFEEIRTRFEDKIKRSIRVQNSGILLNWGEYGSGKTHAAKFFGKPAELQRLASEISSTVPFYVYLTLPKGKNPIEDLFKAFVDKIDVNNIRSLTENYKNDMLSYVEAAFDDTFIVASMKLFFSELPQSIVKSFLYNNLSARELKAINSFGIFRRLSTENDCIKFLSVLFATLTLNKSVYSCINLWIDEFEDVTTLTSTSLNKVNSFLRELFDNTPNNLLIVLNLTQSPLLTSEDLGAYITESVRSRIRDVINFEFPTEMQLTKYMSDLLDQYRIQQDPERLNLYPFDPAVIHKVFVEFRNVSLRRYNDVFSTLLELADYEDVSDIDLNFYERNKREISGANF